jgi:hypothetical protein
MREPDSRYLAFLGADRDELTSHAGNLAAAERAGFDVAESVVTGRAAFDAYEDRYAENVARFLASHPDDPDADAFARRIAAWRDAYARWGRETLGFALYSLRKRGRDLRRGGASRRARTPAARARSSRPRRSS